MQKLAVWLGIPVAIFLSLIGWMYWYWMLAPHQLTADVQYGMRDQKPLMMDVLTPPEANGAGILFMVSGGWKSSTDPTSPTLFAPLLRSGYTVFGVKHISQPECTVSNIVKDVQRAVRYVRLHAEEYNVDPQRLGVVGGSSGGHLSLMLATCADDGNPNAEDPVERVSSAVQCVACFYPPTDLLNLGSSTENPGDGGPPKSFRAGFGKRAESLEEWKILGRELSPIYHITPQMPPTFIVHGDADTLVPVDQSQRFAEQARQQQAVVRLEIRPGKGHGWPGMLMDLLRFAEWFDEHLLVKR
jgi:acetyl esterase/lipase